MKPFTGLRRRPAADFPKFIWDRLIPYSAAAGAALLAAAPAAQAEVIYTPSDIQVTNGLSITIKGEHALNFFIVGSSLEGSMGVTVGKYEGVIRSATQVHGQVDEFAARLSSGASIGPNQQFPRGKPILGLHGFGSISTFSIGPWRSGGGMPVTGYLGFRFIYHAAYHYGWARVTKAGNFSFTINGYAYETEPDRTIMAGDETGALSGRAGAPSLGLLAYGAQALTAWRR